MSQPRLERPYRMHKRLWKKVDGLYSTSPGRDKLLLKLISKLESCHRNNGHGCEECSKEKACLRLWNNISQVASRHKITNQEYVEFGIEIDKRIK